MRAAPRSELALVLEDAVAAFGTDAQVHQVRLQPPDREEVVRAAEFFEHGAIAERIRAMVPDDVPASADRLMASASNIMRTYFGVVATAALVPLAHGVGIDVSLPRLTLVLGRGRPMESVLDLSDSAVLTCPERPTDWPVRGTTVPSADALRGDVVRGLIGNLSTAVGRVARAARVPKKVLWTTAVEQIDALYGTARLDPAHALHNRACDDFEALTQAALIPGTEQANPLRGLLTWERFDDPRLERSLQFRLQCCLCYLIRDGGTHCCSCPRVDKDARADLWLTFDERKAAAHGGERRDDLQSKGRRRRV
jgi:hypothetical protein